MQPLSMLNSGGRGDFSGYVPLPEARRNGLIDPDLVKFLHKQMVDQAQKILVGRKLIEVSEPVGWWMQEVAFTKVTQMGSAYVAMEIEGGTFDKLEGTESSQMAYALFRPFKIPSRELALARKTGTPLRNNSVAHATYLVGRMEDQMIIQGLAIDGTNYDIKGLYQSAEQSVTDPLDFGTSGNALTAAAKAKALVDEYYSGPLWMVLNGTQAGELYSSTISGVGMEHKAVLEILGNGDPNAAKIFISDKITAGTGLVLPAPNKLSAELTLAVDYTVLIKPQPLGEFSSLEGIVVMAGAPAVFQPYHFVTLTSI